MVEIEIIGTLTKGIGSASMTIPAQIDASKFFAGRLLGLYPATLQMKTVQPFLFPEDGYDYFQTKLFYWQIDIDGVRHKILEKFRLIPATVEIRGKKTTCMIYVASASPHRQDPTIIEFITTKVKAQIGDQARLKIA